MSGTILPFIVLSKKSADVENMRHAAATIDDTADPVAALSFHVPTPVSWRVARPSV